MKLHKTAHGDASPQPAGEMLLVKLRRDSVCRTLVHAVYLHTFCLFVCFLSVRLKPFKNYTLLGLNKRGRGRETFVHSLLDVPLLNWSFVGGRFNTAVVGALATPAGDIGEPVNADEKKQSVDFNSHL